MTSIHYKVEHVLLLLLSGHPVPERRVVNAVDYIGTGTSPLIQMETSHIQAFQKINIVNDKVRYNNRSFKLAEHLIKQILNFENVSPEPTYDQVPE